MRVVFSTSTDEHEEIELKPRQDGCIVYADKGKGVVMVTLGNGRTGDIVSVPVLRSDVKSMADALRNALKVL